MKLSIIIPCYNEEDNVRVIYDEIYNVFNTKKISYELIFVNDGSQDNTFEKLNELIKQKKQNIKIVDFSRNFGKEAAIYAGFKNSGGEFVAIIDADLQQRPELIVNMLDILKTNEEYDSVAAYQQKRKEGKILTFFKNTFYKIINRISSVSFVQGASDFRIFRRKMVDAIIEMSEYNRFSKGIFSFVGFKTYYMPYEVEQRRNGTSKWSFIKLFNYAIEGIVAYTTLPLRIPFIFSFILLLISLLLLVLFLIFGIDLIKISIVLMLFLIGLVFMTVGILGEYLSKTYLEVKKRPVYIIKDIKESKVK